MNTNLSNVKQVGITTSPELIKLLGERLYSNPLAVILVRELLQNSVDAILANGGIGAIKITVTANDNQDELNITCSDNGIGMSEDTLVNAFLCIGATRKFSDQSTGGFGIAKVSLFSCDTWKVQTRNLIVSGDITNPSIITDFCQVKKSIQGTAVTAKIKLSSGSMGSYSLINIIERNLSFSVPDKGDIKIYFNGVRIKPTYKTNVIETTSDVCIKVAKVKDTWLIVYRINGLVQYTDWLSSELKNTVLFVDFYNVGFRPRDDDYPFSMSRENIKYQYSSKVNATIQKLTSDVYSIHRSTATGREKKIKIIRGYAYFGRNFSQNERRIMRLYGEIVSIVRISTGRDKNDESLPMIGLTDDSTCIASYQDNSEIGKVYLINASKFVGKSKDGLIIALWHTACHEITHEFEYQQHNEEFTSEMGDICRMSSDRIMAEFSSLKILTRHINQ